MNTPINGRLNKKISVSRFINITLVAVLILVIGFGWWYLKGRSPVDALQTISLTGVPQPKYLYTIYGPDSKRLSSPYYTYVSGDRIYIADTYNSRIVVTDYNGRYLSSFGKKGKHIGAMFSPTNIIEVNNELYVVDNQLGGVEVWDKTGKFKRILGDLKFPHPFAITFANNKFYLLDTSAMKCIILDRNGKFIKTFGQQGRGNGEFYYFYGITSRDNQIYISDSNNNRIQIFDENGKFLKAIYGKDSKGGGGLSIPRGVAFDAKGNIFTAEMLSNQVAILDAQGVYQVGFSYAEPSQDGVTDQISVPTSVFIDQNNRLYVTEMGKSRVLVYQL